MPRGVLSQKEVEKDGLKEGLNEILAPFMLQEPMYNSKRKILNSWRTT